MLRTNFKIIIILIGIIIVASILRLPFLDVYPPALYSDEVAQAYNAYSILNTGRDEHGVLLPVSLRSFGDWKPPLQTYTMTPFIALFGLNSYGVRLSPAIFGIITVFLMYFFTRCLLNSSLVSSKSWTASQKTKASLLSALFLCISPWHILQSRSAMLVGLALFLYIFGIWCFIACVNNRNFRLWYISSFIFSLTIYSYYGMRVVVPLTFLFLLVIFRREVYIYRKQALISVVIGLILLLPLAKSFFNNPNVIFGRAKTISIFYDRGIELTVWDLIAQDGNDMNPKLARFLHNKPYHYAIDIVRRFFHHFDGRFLFLEGDKHLPFQIPKMGVVYLLDGTLIIVGGLWLIKNRRTTLLLIYLIGLVTIAVVPASLTFLTPSANRTFNMVLPLLIITALGAVVLTQRINRLLFTSFMIIGYSLSLMHFMMQYFVVLPHDHADWWLYGYKDLYEYLKVQESKYENIFISANASMPYIYYLFYNQVDPQTLAARIDRNYTADEFGFEHVNRVDNYRFIRDFSWESDVRKIPANSLMVVTQNESVGNNTTKLHQINYPNQKPAFLIYKISN